MLTLDTATDMDLAAFVPMELQRAEYATIKELFYGKPKDGIFVFRDGDSPMLIIGLMPKWPRVYDTATLYSVNWKPIYFRQVIKKAKEFFLFFDYDRIEHMIHCDRPWTDKMIEAFGFTYNTTIRKAYGGKDFKLYEIVNG